MKNQFLNAGESVLFIEHQYCDSNGSFSTATIWTGERIRKEIYASAYNHGSFDDAEITCTDEEKALAVEWYVNNAEDNARGTFVGCTVVLARSKKAPNGVEMKVIGFDKGEYNELYRHAEPDLIKVDAPECPTWVSINCIKEVTKYAPPFWA